MDIESCGNDTVNDEWSCLFDNRPLVGRLKWVEVTVM